MVCMYRQVLLCFGVPTLKLRIECTLVPIDEVSSKSCTKVLLHQMQYINNNIIIVPKHNNVGGEGTYL